MSEDLVHRLGMAAGGLSIHGISDKAIVDAINELARLEKQNAALLAAAKKAMASIREHVCPNIDCNVSDCCAYRALEVAVEFAEAPAESVGGG